MNINTGKVTLLAGRNEQGKSSAVQAIVALLTSNPAILGLKKKDARLLVNEHGDAGFAQLRHDENTVTIHWPNMEVNTVGVPPQASAVACGLVKISALKPKEVADLLTGVMGIKASKADVEEALREHMSQDIIDAVWEMIEREGWDATHAHLTEQARNLKAEWRSITKENWGAQVASTWKPEHYAPAMETENEDFFLAEFNRSQSDLERAIESQAIDGERLRALQDRAGKYDGLVAEFNALKEELAKLEEDQKQTAERLRELPPTQAGVSFPCPECKTPLQWLESPGGRQMVKAEKVDEAALKEIRLERAKLDGHTGWLGNQISETKSKIAAVKERGKDSQEAVVLLRKMENLPPEEGAVTPSAVDMAREFAKRCELQLSDFRRYLEAKSLHRRITRALKAADEASGDGVRKRLMQACIARFNEECLRPVYEQFGISPVEIDGELQVRYAGRPYILLSESAKFRTDVALQIAVARLDGSAMIVIDGADIIIGPDRVGLLRVLLWSGIESVVAMALNKPESAPNLAGHGGVVYWLEDGVAKQL